MRFAYLLLELPHVTGAWSRAEDGLVVAWVFIGSDTIQKRREVFEAEQAVMDEFPDLDFDFYVLSEPCREAFVNGQHGSQQFYSRTLAIGVEDCHAIGE
jgi:hypothetical protein